MDYFRCVNVGSINLVCKSADETALLLGAAENKRMLIAMKDLMRKIKFILSSKHIEFTSELTRIKLMMMLLIEGRKVLVFILPKHKLPCG